MISNNMIGMKLKCPISGCGKVTQGKQTMRFHLIHKHNFKPEDAFYMISNKLNLEEMKNENVETANKTEGGQNDTGELGTEGERIGAGTGGDSEHLKRIQEILRKALL